MTNFLPWGNERPLGMISTHIVSLNLGCPVVSVSVPVIFLESHLPLCALFTPRARALASRLYSHLDLRHGRTFGEWRLIQSRFCLQRRLRK